MIVDRPEPALYSSAEACADALIARVGRDIRIGMPLGLGKPVELVNALYARAKADPTLSLTVLTALSLERPDAGPGVQGALMGPFLDRVFADAPALDYLTDLRKKRLPPNVTVREFFFKPGSLIGNAHAQQNYISTNYTHAARDVFNNGCNVAAQMICKRETPEGLRYSLSCNPDTGPELVEMLREAERRGERAVAVVGLVNQNLPYMANDAEVTPELFDMVIDAPAYTKALFSTPKLPVGTADYLIGLNASALVRDAGTLQIGIGALGDAIVYSLMLRHGRNAEYRDAIEATGIHGHHASLIARDGGLAPFQAGLYGATEMFVDGFMHLYKAGILTRRVYDFPELQHLLNEGRVDPEGLTPAVLDRLEAEGVRVIRTRDFQILQHHGLFRDDCAYELGHVIAPDGARIPANLALPESRARLAATCLGNRLRNGVFAHGGFFLGPRAFYDDLRAMTDAERAGICMTAVKKINQLDVDPELYSRQRVHARFINTGIMATLSGAVVSDGLANGQVVSGVGGQYNFVAMAHALPTGRSILLIKSVRDKEGGAGATSNVVFNYGHCTIPRHLRDIVITEYGIADLRSRCDADVAKALINIADSRFQDGLLDEAKAAGKIEAGYEIPATFRNNTPASLEERIAPFRRLGLFPTFPLGTDFEPRELQLIKALKAVKAEAGRLKWWQKLKLAGQARDNPPVPGGAEPFLERVNLTAPTETQDKVTRLLLARQLEKQKAWHA